MTLKAGGGETTWANPTTCSYSWHSRSECPVSSFLRRRLLCRTGKPMNVHRVCFLIYVTLQVVSFLTIKIDELHNPPTSIAKLIHLISQ